MDTQEKLKEYESLLEKIFNEGQKTIGVVQSGPDERGLYRVTTDGSEIIVFSQVKKKIEPDTEVLIVQNAFIESILSEPLKMQGEVLDFEPVKWNQIGGLRSQVDRIRDTIEGPLKNKRLYEEFGLEPLKGILLYGPSGVGKTMIAKAIATTVLDKREITKDSFVYLKGGELLSEYVGKAEANIRTIFNNCREAMKKTGVQSTVFIDEAEAIVPRRGSRVSSDVDSTIVPTFLAEMDGLNKNNPFVILATNLPQQIDDAVLRPGRIDVHVKIDRPNRQDSEEIFDIYYNKSLCKDKASELSALSAELLFNNNVLSQSVSGAFIKNIVQKSTLHALRRYAETRKEKGVTKQDVTEVFNLIH